MKKELEPHSNIGKTMEDVILGGQDGLVNVLGIVLGVAVATNDFKVILIAGMAAAVAETISMVAVAYTSNKAYSEYYDKELENEIREIKELPDVEKQEIREIFEKKGFEKKEIEQLVKIYSSNEKAWIDLMLAEELKMRPQEETNPVKSSLLVGISCLIASLIPIVPFFFAPVSDAIIYAVILSGVILFIGGGIKSRFTLKPFLHSAIELTAIGLIAALGGYAVGLFFTL